MSGRAQCDQNWRGESYLRHAAGRIQRDRGHRLTGFDQGQVAAKRPGVSPSQTFEVSQTSNVFGPPTGDALAAARRMAYTGARRIPPIRF